MAGYEIGISGLKAAQRALDVIGNNIANAATEGYHKQDINLRAASESYSGGFMIGQGVDFVGVLRRINSIIEEQLLDQDATMSSLSRQMESLQSIESALGELATSGISTSLDNFYNAFSDLSLRPNDVTLQSAVVSAAQTLTNQVRNIASVITDLQDMTYSEAQSTVGKINELTTQIAGMNDIIYSQQVREVDSSNTMDQRDKLIIELNRLVAVKVTEKEYGQVDVVVSGIQVIAGNYATPIQADLLSDGGTGTLVLSVIGSEQIQAQAEGGSLGGVFTLQNTVLQEIIDKLDTLAQTVISETNKVHVQGVGTSGSFTSQTGWTMTQENVLDFVPPVTAGTIYVRMTAPDGSVSRHAVPVDSSSTLQSIADDLAAIPGLEDDTGLNNGRLQIIANSGYSFDFLPGVLSEPSSYIPNPLAGAGAGAAEMPPTIQISGLYTGSLNQDYTCTVQTTPAGQTNAVGSGVMQLVIQDGTGTTIALINVGEGYEAGTEVSLENGIKISLGSNGVSPGYLNDGEVFTISALANSDTSGFLAAAGINCFFSGTDASSVALNENIVQSGQNIAVSRSADQVDNANVAVLAQLGQTAITSLGGLTTTDYYRNLTVDVGNQLSFMQLQYDNSQGIYKNLEDQRNEVSGVDINDQAMQMMVYERMFQAMSKYMNTVFNSIDTMMTILS
jgi:flagellar hook-associated protein FlgK